MKGAKENIIAQETFLIMCKMLKNQEGIYHYEIAKCINVNTSLLSRWSKGSHNISRHYNERIYTYLNQARFEYLGEALKRSMIRRLKLNPKGRIGHHILSLNYTNLLRYLFYGLTTEELEKENRQRNLYFDMAKNTLIRKTMDRHIDGKEFNILNDIYRDITPAVRQKCEQLQITNRNTMIIEIKIHQKPNRNVIVLFSSDHYDYEDTSVDAKLEFITAERCLGDFNQFIMVTDPCEYISRSYERFEYQTTFVDIENINVAKIERYVDFLVGKILNTIFEE